MGPFRRNREPEPITDPGTSEVYTGDDLNELGRTIMRTWLHGGGFDETDAQNVRDRLTKET